MARIHLSKDIIIEVEEASWWLEDQITNRMRNGYSTITLTDKKTDRSILIFFSNILYIE